MEGNIETALREVKVSAHCTSDKLYVHLRFLGTWPHSAITLDHLGECQTQQPLNYKNWWLKMSNYIHRVLSSCSICSQCKTSRTILIVMLVLFSSSCTSLVPHSSRFCDWSACLSKLYYHPHCSWLISPWGQIPSLSARFRTAEILFNFVFHFFGTPVEILFDKEPSYPESGLLSLNNLRCLSV